MKQPRISFGDNVRIKESVETKSLGLIGLIGQVFGETTPSVTGIEIIGKSTQDYGINVFFEDRNESLWFAPNLLEFVDHGGGIVATLKGVNKKWVRSESGEWKELPLDEES